MANAPKAIVPKITIRSAPANNSLASPLASVGSSTLRLVPEFTIINPSSGNAIRVGSSEDMSATGFILAPGDSKTYAATQLRGSQRDFDLNNFYIQAVGTAATNIVLEVLKTRG